MPNTTQNQHTRPHHTAALIAPGTTQPRASSIGTQEQQRWRRFQPWFFLLAIVCAGTYWFSHWDTERQPHHLPAESLPDFIINDFTSHTYNEEGERSYQLSAIKLTHYEKSDESHLDKPEFHAEPATGQHGWHATAERGVAAGGKDRIHLEQNVTLTTDGSPQHAYRVHTDTLDLYPNKKQAHTDSKVRVTQANHLITSIGFSADWSLGELSLNQEVKSHYAIAP